VVGRVYARRHLLVFGFKTPVPYPFGIERTGYLVSDFDTAIDSAKANHIDIVVAPIGRDDSVI
jgi:hypothetical protein